MTTHVTVAQGEYVTCPDCDGSGLTSTGHREHDTGEWITRPCSGCHGDCTVDAAYVTRCESCGTVHWIGEGCTHLGNRCPDCSTSCGDCKSEALDEAAYEAFLELTTLSGGGR